MPLAMLPVSVSPAMLTSIATGLAAAVDADDLLVDPDDYRGYTRLLHTDAYEAWLIAWGPGGSLDLHDHGGSAGAVVVVDGELLERFTDRRHRRPLRTHHLRPHRPLAIAPTRVHGVWNPGPANALSVHVYSPPLSTMTFYDPRRLTPRRTEPADISA